MFGTSSITSLVPPLPVDVPLWGTIDFSLPLTALIIFVGLNILFWFIRKVLIVRFHKLSDRTSNDFDDAVVQALESIRVWVYSIVSIYAAIHIFPLPAQVDLFSRAIFLFAVVWQAIGIASIFVNYFATHVLEKDEDGDGVIDPGAATASSMVTLMAQIVLWSLGILFVLSNLGIEVTSLLAGLGIGGIAIAFALQGILADLFASFSIYFDKPFRIGDYIVIGTDKGYVERIGIKSTRLRTLQGEELVVSNAELTTARVNNFKKLKERRITSEFGVTYETEYEKLSQVTNIVERIFSEIQGGRLNRVFLTTLGDSALIFQVVYYVESSAVKDYLHIQQQFNFALIREFREAGIDFAYPTQTLYTKQVS